MATAAKPLNGYIVQVKGYADSTGNPTTNQQLSLDRSEAVIAYLEQSGGISVLHIGHRELWGLRALRPQMKRRKGVQKTVA